MLILGGGKTGIDAALYLLDHGVSPDKVSWIIPNDAWFLNRENFDFNSPDILNMFKVYFSSLMVETDDTWQKCYKT